MTIIPNQPFGLGDIIFCQTLVRRIADGRPIVWPVFPQFVEGLNRAYPDIKFIDWNLIKGLGLDFERKDQYTINLGAVDAAMEYTVLPIRFADSLMKVEYKDCMKAKYMMYGMRWEDWQEQAMWVRSTGNETNLHYFITSIENDIHEEYSLVNRTFGSAGNLKANIPTCKNEIEIIERPGYSLFDWVMSIQPATEIHTVSTSIIYLLEMLDLKAKEVHLYPRKPIEYDFRNVDYLLRKHKYILHA